MPASQAWLLPVDVHDAMAINMHARSALLLHTEAAAHLHGHLCQLCLRIC